MQYWNQNTITTIMSDPSKIKDLEVNDSGAITEALAASLAAGIAKADGSIPPFMTYHPAACWLPGTAPATSGDFFPESEWLSMDIIQSGHIDVKTMGLQGDARFIDSWDPRSSVVPVRRMYDARTKEGKPRPVMDSEGHYESTK